MGSKFRRNLFHRMSATKRLIEVYYRAEIKNDKTRTTMKPTNAGADIYARQNYFENLRVQIFMSWE